MCETNKSSRFLKLRDAVDTTHYVIDGCTFKINSQTPSAVVHFERVYEHTVANDTIFLHNYGETIANAMQGRSTTTFAYGASGTGKVKQILV